MSDNTRRARMAIRSAVVTLADATAQVSGNVNEVKHLLVVVSEAVDALNEARDYLRDAVSKGEM